MTFSIAAHDGDAWGVAVASKFLAVGSVVPAVRHGIGAVATQAMARVGYHDDVLDALSGGASVGDALAAAVAADERRDHRQVGAVGRTGAPRRSPGRSASAGRAGWPRATTAPPTPSRATSSPGPGSSRRWRPPGSAPRAGPSTSASSRPSWPGTRRAVTRGAGRARRSSPSRRAPATTAAACSPTCGSTTTPTPRASWPGCTTCRRCSSAGPRASSRCVAPCATRWGLLAATGHGSDGTTWRRPRGVDVAGQPRDAALPRRHRRAGARGAAGRGSRRRTALTTRLTRSGTGPRTPRARPRRLRWRSRRRWWARCRTPPSR